MAITLAEAKIGMADKVDQQIVDMFRRSSLLLDKMVFDNAISPGLMKRTNCSAGRTFCRLCFSHEG
mgnify:CR=1 FL=1